MKKFSILVMAALLLVPLVQVKAATIVPGMLIKASGPAVYYFTDKNTRLVFPDEKTYFSWFTNFNTVTIIPDGQLSNIPLGGNVTYRPGKYLVKITTNPKTYAIDADNSLRWIRTEQVARDLYGANWAKMVQDVPDSFFSDYAEGSAIQSTADYNPSAVLASRMTIITGVATPSNEATTGEIVGAPVSPVVASPVGTCTVPAEAQAESVANPTTVVGNGTAASCTAAAFEAAVQNGGIVTFNCGPDVVTITLDHEIRLLNKVGPNKNGSRVIDGGGKVILSGGSKNRILYQNACEESLGWLNDHCNTSLYPRLVVQNLTFTNGKASDKLLGGGAIYSNGGSLKVVNSKFYDNEIVSTGPDVAGGAIYQTQGYGPTYIVNSTFGGSADLGNVGSNGGALGGLFSSFHIYNSMISYNKAIGTGRNPAASGTLGGGSGGAIYMDGNSFTLNMCGTEVSNNSAKELGGAIFYVANDVKGDIKIDQSVFKKNVSGSSDGPAPGIAKPGCYLQTTASKISLTNTTFE
ncbi:MAG: hypothetical protein KIH65_004115 [Candidatus Uhrbacteria bacterium]|nr:hypothetical protein [Candidatus Uhrbacteria bacterium]